MKVEHMTSPRPSNANDSLNLRAPNKNDGAGVWELVRASGTLDENSMYCNMLQCTHFSATCALAELNGEIVGWMSGYIPPEEPDVLFVWQICVSEKARGRGLAKKLIKHVLDRAVCADVKRIKSTITEDNEASWALFGAVARGLEAEMKRKAHFTEDHFNGQHDTEHMVTIGPFGHEDEASSRSAA